ncbi:pilus assembly protein PilP [Thermodesulfobacteriota bacterium]
MDKNVATIFKLVCLILLGFFLWSCGEKAETPEPQKVVRKKIAVQQAAPAKPAAPVPAKPAPAPQKEAAKKPEPPTTSQKEVPAVAEVKKPPEQKPVIAKAPAQEEAATIPVTPASSPASQEDRTKPETVSGEKTRPPVTGKAEETTIEKAKVLAAASLETVEDIKEEEVQERINPFAPLFKDKAAPKPQQQQKTTERRIPLTPLEKIDLSQLKLVAIIRAESGNRALVEEASGKGYVVTRGTYIGIRSGRIIDILRDRLVIEEEIEDAFGKVIVSTRELTLQKPPGEF